MKTSTIERIATVPLILFAVWYILSLIVVLFGGSANMLRDILINISASIICSLAVTIFAYFKFLKRIPEENRQKIDQLLNERLGYETTNHSDTTQKIIAESHHLSDEHRDLQKGVSDLLADKELKRMQYENLGDKYRTIADSINNISMLGERMEELHQENLELKNENRELKLEIRIMQNPNRDYEHERGIKHSLHH